MPKANPILDASGNYCARVRVWCAPASAKMKCKNIIWYPSKDPYPSTRTRARTYCGWAVPWQEREKRRYKERVIEDITNARPQPVEVIALSSYRNISTP